MPTQADHSGHSGHGWLNVCTLAPLKVCALALVLGAGAVAMQLVVGLACEVPAPPLLSPPRRSPPLPSLPSPL